MLYAEWCRSDVERVDDLEQRIRRVSELNMTPFSDGGVRNLNAERQAVMAEIGRKKGDTGGNGMPLEIMLTFPGMPNYKKPVS